MTDSADIHVNDDPWSNGPRERIALALSILGHAPDCNCCAVTIDRTRLALQGATVDEVARLCPPKSES